MSTKKTFVIAGVAAAASFLWGISVYRSQVFPYALVESVATKVGIVKERTPISPAAAPLAVLKSLPYVQASFDPDNELRGVVTFDRAKAQPGVNFYSVYKQDGAYLIDMHGNIIHEWAYASPKRFWHNAELLSDGSLLAVVKDYALLKLDRCSELLWSYKTEGSSRPLGG